MLFSARLAGTLLLALSLVTGYVQVASAQDAPAAQDAQPAKPAKAPAKPAPKVPPKAGEVIPFDQLPGDQAQPAQDPAPSAPAAPAVQPKGKPAPKAPADTADAVQPPAKGQKAPAVPARAKGASGRIALGALLPLSGAHATQGQASRVAIEMAVADLNEYLAEAGSPVRVSVQIEDTASSKAKALEKIKALSVSGVKLVIGPYTDDEVDGVLDFAGKNGMVLLSQGSAGPYLAKPGDALLRFSPSDAFQAEALAVLANQEGCTQLIPIWEGDMYGDELVTHVKGQFANLGGQVLPGTRFKPDTTQFASFVADLKAQVDKNVKDKKKLAILVAARGNQTAGILREAARLAGLDEARWYGGDDSALRGSIIQDQAVAQYAAKVRMAFARYGETGTELYTAVEKRLEERIQAFADTQSLVAYDLVWLAAYANMASGDDVSALAKAVPATAERFYGVTGWLALNENGDRREDYDFDFWTIKNIDGKFYWIKTARYQFDPGSVKQLIVNAPEK